MDLIPPIEAYQSVLYSVPYLALGMMVRESTVKGKTWYVLVSGLLFLTETFLVVFVFQAEVTSLFVTVYIVVFFLMRFFIERNETCVERKEFYFLRRVASVMYPLHGIIMDVVHNTTGNGLLYFAFVLVLTVIGSALLAVASEKFRCLRWIS